ncbi:MAG: caspase family protein [Bacteroidia bacterium]|nr:caspase family protein [Bacteroidia bacterium]
MKNSIRYFSLITFLKSVKLFVSLKKSLITHHLSLITCFCTLFAIHCSLLTYSQSNSPTLTLNTIGHTAEVKDISVDALGKYILTCSLDKTAKLWNADDGSLIRTYRLPIDENSGMLYTCALSPDGNTVALSGFTYPNYVYIFNSQTGVLVQALTGLPGFIFNIEFSPDGKHLAVAFGEQFGVYIYGINDLNRFNLIKKLTGYEGACFNVSFDREGRMATICLDGKIRLYDAGFSLINERLMQEGTLLQNIAFSPDGSKLAVGYNDSPVIEILDSKNLFTIYKPDITGSVGGTSTHYVTFSSDGNYLYSDGAYSRTSTEPSTCPIRKWGNAGKGELTLIPVSDFWLSTIKPLPGGDMVFCGAEGVMGRISSNGTILYQKSGEIIPVNKTGETILTINNNGSVVGIPSHKPELIYSVSEKKLTVNESGKNIYSNELHPYCDSTATIRISDWSRTASPILNGNRLSFIEKYDICLCVDITDNCQNIVFGTVGKLYCTNAAGEVLWSISDNSGFQCSVNISGNGKTVAALVTDGLINWYRMSDGKLLLSLFIHPDQKRWVMYTPSGYYDCSPGAENLIGWNVNNLGPSSVIINQLEKDMPAEKAGLQPGDTVLYYDNIKITSIDQATEIGREKDELDSFKISISRARKKFDIYVKPIWSEQFKRRRIGITSYIEEYPRVRESSYYPADRFFETYYRPDLIQEIFKNYETDQEILKRWGDQANSVSSMKKPPLVKIIFPSPGSNSVENVTVNVEVTDQGGGIDEVLLFQNGKLVETTQRGFKPLEENGVKKTRTYQLSLSSGENKIKASAFSTERIESNPDEITLNYTGAEKSATLYLLVLGINNYKNSIYNLNYARADAQSIRESLLGGSKTIFKDVKVYELYDEQATRSNIESKINEIASLAGQNDMFVFFYAGHGAMSEQEENQPPVFYLIPTDVTKMFGDNEILKNLAVSAFEIREWCKNIKAQKQLIMMDACQSGGVVDAFAMRTAAEEKAILQLARSAGVAVMSSTGTDQYAAEFTQIGHGVFTYAVLDGLSGNADGGAKDKKITVKELEAYINDLIPELTKKYRGQAQYPNSFSTGMDFPVVIVK